MRKIISMLLTLMLVLGSFGMAFASSIPWNYGQKVNYTPIPGERVQTMSSWFTADANKIGLVPYEKFNSSAYRGSAFLLFERIINARLERNNMTLIEPRGTYIPFNDQNKVYGDAKSEITALYELSILRGDNKGNMLLDQYVKRGEVAAILTRFNEYCLNIPVYGNRQPKVFEDTRNHWAKNDVSYCYQIGLVDGMSNTNFGVNYEVTIEELATIAFNLEGKFGITLADIAKGLEQTFKCVTSIGNTNGKVSSLSSHYSSYNFEVGDKRIIEITINPMNADNKKLDISSSNSKIAAVTSITQAGNGNIAKVTVEGMKKGTTNLNISATDSSNKKLVIPINVGGTSNDGVEINTPDSNLKVGQTMQINYTSNYNVTFSSSNTNVATVDSNGKVTGISNGTATITAKTSSGSDSIKVTITSNSTSGNIDLITSDFNLIPGESKTIIWNCSENVTFSSSDTNIATVNNNGKVTAIGNGTVIITITSASGNSASLKVIIDGGSFNPSPTEVTMNVLGTDNGLGTIRYYNARSNEVITIIVSNVSSLTSDDITLNNLSLVSKPQMIDGNTASFQIQAGSQSNSGVVGAKGASMEIRVYEAI